MTRLAVALAAAAVLALGGLAAAARDERPTARVTPRPATLEVGRAWNATILVRGRSGRPSFELRNGARRRVIAAAPDGLNRWRVRVVFPSAGRWAWTVRVRGLALARGSVLATARLRLKLAFGMVMRGDELLVADSEAHRVYRVDLSSGRLTPFAGTGLRAASGDGGSALRAAIGVPTGIAVGPDGSVYLADILTGRVRRIDPAGRISTVAETDEPADVAVDPAGNVYVATLANYVFRVAGGGGPLVRVAGDGTEADSGDGGPAALARVSGPHGIETDAAGNVLFSTNGRIRRIDARTGVIETVAGTGDKGYGGDGGPAREARIDTVKLVLAPDGTIYEAGGSFETGSRVRRIAPDGIITTVAGNGRFGPVGDGGQATEAGFRAADVQLAPDGSLLLLTAVDPWAGVRRIDLRTGIITTVARGRAGE